MVCMSRLQAAGLGEPGSVSAGTVIAEDAPVAWERDFRRDPASGELLQSVGFRSREAMLEFNQRKTPFVVGVIKAKDYTAQPLQFKEFVAVREVMPTGCILNDSSRPGDEPDYYSIETKVLRRLTGSDY